MAQNDNAGLSDIKTFTTPSVGYALKQVQPADGTIEVQREYPIHQVVTVFSPEAFRIGESIGVKHQIVPTTVVLGQGGPGGYVPSAPLPGWAIPIGLTVPEQTYDYWKVLTLKVENEPIVMDKLMVRIGRALSSATNTNTARVRVTWHANMLILPNEADGTENATNPRLYEAGGDFILSGVNTFHPYHRFVTAYEYKNGKKVTRVDDANAIAIISSSANATMYNMFGTVYSDFWGEKDASDSPEIIRFSDIIVRVSSSSVELLDCTLEPSVPGTFAYELEYAASALGRNAHFSSRANETDLSHVWDTVFGTLSADLQAFFADMTNPTPSK